MKSAINIRKGLKNRPSMKKITAKACPNPAAIWVALALSMVNASKARKTRPPSIGKAGIKLKTTSITLAIKR